MKKTFKISINYISNFQFFGNFLKTQKSKINCKNFILFIFFFNFLLKKYNWFYKFIYFFKPKYSVNYTLLRAPYRYKLSRDQLTFSRYFLLISFVFKNPFYLIRNINNKDIIKFISFFYKFIPFFETNIYFQKKITLYFNFFFENNFQIMNYKSK